MISKSNSIISSHLQETINEWRKQRAKEEEELKKLKEQQARRKEIRAEQEVSHHLSFFGLYLCQFQVRLAKQKKEEEEKIRAEEAEKKAKEAEEKRKRLEEAEKKRPAGRPESLWWAVICVTSTKILNF